MHLTPLTAPEQRVLGCLIEKRFTTPDQYPLSLNALRLAANQSTNRDPVVDYDEHTVNEAAQRLSRYGIARLASGHSSRATKYRHLAEEALGVDAHELSLICVLLLRGPQTPGELKGRTERMAAFGELAQVEAGLDSLARKGYVVMIGRRPGQKEDRWAQLLGGETPQEPAAPAVAPAAAPPQAVTAPPQAVTAPSQASTAPPQVSAAPSALSVGVAPEIQPGGPPAPATSAGSGTPRPTVTDLEARLARLEAEVAELRAALGG